VLTFIEVSAFAAFALAWAQMGWADWNEQKIRNRLLARWFGLIVAAYGLLAAHTVLGERGVVSSHIVWSYYGAALAYVAVSCAAGGVLWALRIWPAGDVKLYVLLSLYLPLMRIPLDFRSGLRFLEVLINVFIPAAVFLFLTAGEYLWRTRFREQGAVVAGLGWERWPRLAAEKVREALPALKAGAEELVRTYRDPRALLRDVLSWLASVSVMALLSYYLGDVLKSDFLKTVVCFALFFVWSRFSAMIGRGRSLALVLVLLGAVGLLGPAIRWDALLHTFGDISVFSLFIFMGVQVAFKIVAGQSGFVFLPLLFMLPAMIPWGRLLGTLDPARWLPAAAPSAFSGVGVWAGMGLFFGLSLVFVRIWDAESYKSVKPEHIAPYMTLGPALVERLEADEEFFEERFGTLYADGLTREQVEALKEWCLREEVEVVPLAPTISFANWIFVGYLLTWLLDGHVLRMVY
jgi:hypothetical protein